MKKAALDAIWRETEAQGDSMLPLRTHAMLLGDAIFGIVQEQPVAFSVWHPVWDLLRMSSFVEDVKAQSPAVELDYCGFAESDRAFGEMARLWLAGTMIFGLVWQAYELSVLARKPKSSAQGQDGVKLIAAGSDGMTVPRLSELTHAVTQDLSDLVDKRRKTETERQLAEFDIDHTPAALAARALASFRNALIHGQLVAPLTPVDPEDDDLIEGERKIRVFYDVIRLTLVLIQLLFAGAFDDDEETEFRGDLENVRDLMQGLHMRPVLQTTT